MLEHDDDPAARWFALMTTGAAGFRERRRAFTEFAAAERLVDAGFDAFAPTLSILVKVHRKAKRRETLLVPLLPGYCFARFDDGVPPRDRIMRWREVIDVVRIGDEPAQIPTDQVLALRWLSGTETPLDASGQAAGDAAARQVQPGDLVEHRGAAFEGVRAEVESVYRDKAVLLMRLLGSLQRVTADTADLHVVGG